MSSYLSKVQNKPPNKVPNKVPNKPNVARQADVGNEVATLAENVSLPDPKEKLSKITKELELAEGDARAAHDEHVRLAKNLDRLEKSREGADENEAEVVKWMIMDVNPKVADGLVQAKEASDRVVSLRVQKKEAADAVERAIEEISKKVPPEKKTTDAAEEYFRKLPKTDPALPGLQRTTHRVEKKPVPKSSTRQKKVPAPTALKTFNAAIGIGEEPLIDKEGNINPRAIANTLIEEKGLGRHLEQIVDLERARHSINAGIQKMNELVNEATTQLVGDGTLIPAVEAATKQLEVLQTQQGSLKSVIQSAKGQFLAMYNANKVKEFRDLNLDELMKELKSTDFVSLAAVASAAQHGNDAHFFLTIARSCFALGALGLFADTVVSSLTRRDLELKFLAHGISSGIGAAGVVEWWRGNLAGVSDSSKTLAVGTCMLASLWALGVF
jgi:hypothetical protein